MRHFLNTGTDPLQFRTNSTGDILLRSDWAAVLCALRSVPAWIVQTLHPLGRLVGRFPVPAWNLTVSSPSVSDPAGGLDLDFNHWDHAVARIEKCPCCDSPGYIEIRNALAQPILQFRAPSGTPVGPLATIAAQLAAPSGLAPASSFGSPEIFQPRLDAAASPTVPAAGLPEFLTRLGAAGVALRWRLSNAGCDHRGLFTPSSVRVEAAVLTATGVQNNTCQLILPAAHALMLESSSAAERVHVLATDSSLLLTIAPALGRHHPAWAGTVLSLFSANR